MTRMTKQPPNHAPPTSEHFLFVKKFFQHGTRVASFAPSSKALSKAMTRHVTKDRPQTILELGAGTGAVTAAALEHAHPQSRLIAIEIDPDFAQRLATKCPRAEVWTADVLDLPAKMRDARIDRFDLVLSGLPVPSLPKRVNAAVFDCVRQFAHGAVFSQLTVMPWVYQGMYRKLFREVEFNLVLRNFPSGGVYHCRNLRDDYTKFIPGKG